MLRYARPHNRWLAQAGTVRGGQRLTRRCSRLAPLAAELQGWADPSPLTRVRHWRITRRCGSSRLRSSRRPSSNCSRMTNTPISKRPYSYDPIWASSFRGRAAYARFVGGLRVAASVAACGSSTSGNRSPMSFSCSTRTGRARPEISPHLSCAH